MIKKALTPGQAVAIALFVFSCFAVLLYLWITFGGSSPLKPKGYQIQANFPEATLLAQEADVRISGVPVGRVVSLQRDGNRTRATLEIKSRFAPLPSDTRALLRLKTLFGETYVELTPGTRNAPKLPDGGSLPNSAISRSVELDEVLKTFDPRTRAAFRSWLQTQAAGIDGRGADLNAAFGSLPGFVDSANGLLATLDSQSAAVRRLVSSTGDFFGAISEREGELRSLITDANGLFQTTAARNQDLADVFRQLPRFEREATITLPELSAFAQHAQPLVKRLQPAATQFDPLFKDVARLSPEFNGFFDRLNQVVIASKPGLPAFDRILARVPSLLDAFQPFLRNANPVLSYIGVNEREVTAFFANVTAAAQIKDQSAHSPHFLRTAQTLGSTALSFYPRPLGSTRLNPYVAPGGMSKLASGLSVLDNGYCNNTNPLPPASTGPGSLPELVTTYGIRTTGRDEARPPCTEQGVFPGFGTKFPQLTAEP